MTLSRRAVLLAAPALAMLPARLVAQAARPELRARGLHNMTLAVTDVKRSLDFYQGLLGMPIQARQGSAVLLRIGKGPHFLALSPAGANPPGITHYGIAVENFNVDHILSVLAEHGVTRADPAAPGLSDGALKVRVATREGTPEIFVGDPSGIVFQLQDPTYCGGTGPLGNVCPTVQPSPFKGLIAAQDYSHFTIFATNAEESNAFHQALFGWGIQAYQGPAAPVLGVGPGAHFVMFAGAGGGAARGARGGAAAPAPAPSAGGAPPAPAGRGVTAPRVPRIDHACLGMQNFHPDVVVKLFESYGIKPRGTAASTPLVWYISQRMENRGGAPGTGTPELYFTDPDNIPIQIQDVRYCGGGGFLGDECPG
jgi:catechol 2,3-dioxygenase-like lactoylglutathione lyase family enzyme